MDLYGFSQTSTDGLIPNSRDFLLPCSVASHRIPGPRPMYWSLPAASESFSPLRLEVMVQWWLMLKHYRVGLKMGDTMITWLQNRENGDNLTRKMLINLINIEKLSIFGGSQFLKKPMRGTIWSVNPKGDQITQGESFGQRSFMEPTILFNPRGRNWNMPQTTPNNINPKLLQRLLMNRMF